jgi:N-formylglutamate amidohydrolase
MTNVFNFIIICTCFASNIIDLITASDLYFSGYRNAFKAFRLNLTNTNIILSSPHAGSVMPHDIPDRTQGGCRQVNSSVCTYNYTDMCIHGQRCSITTVQDFADFDPFTERVADELYRTYGLRPFVIVATWNRKKIDFNREINEATFNHPTSMKAYRGYHRYLTKAIERIEQRYHGQGLLLDIHQHGQGK